MNIAKDLMVGIENARTSKELQIAYNISERELMRQIEKERKNGAVICSGNRGEGYFLPRNTVEILNFYRTTRKKALSILATLKSTRNALLNCYDGQFSFDELVTDEKLFAVIEDEDEAGKE